MTSFPPVDDLPETAAGSLLGTFSKLAELRQPQLAAWAEAVSDALLTRLVEVTTGVQRDGDSVEPVPLAKLDAAEIEGLHWIVVVAGESDDAARGWLTQLGRLILADVERRDHDQAVIAAKLAAIEAEEHRIAREKQPPPNLNGIPPWSEASKLPEPRKEI